MPTTEYDPATLKRVINHDASRRQKQLDAVMAKLAEEQPGLVEQPSLHEAPTPAPIEDEKTALPAPVLEPASELPELPPLEPPPAEEPAPATDWETEAKRWQKRYGDIQKIVTPLQQKSIVEAKERESTKSEIQALKEMITTLAQTVAQASLPKQEPSYDPDLDPDLDNIDPILAERFRRMNRSMAQSNQAAERKLREEIEALKQKDQERQRLSETSQAQAQDTAWEATFTTLVPDFAQFLPGTPHGQNLAVWASKMAPEYTAAIERPKSYTPYFVAQIVNAYKASLRPSAATRKPSLGDIANPSLTGSAPVKVSVVEPESFCSTYEMQNASKIMDEMMRKATNTKNKDDRAALLQEAEDFSSKYQRTLQKRNNQRG